jgi:peptide/nickel transport system permease protein
VSGEAVIDFSEAPPAVSEWHRFVRVFFQRKVVLAGLVVLAVMAIAAIFCNWLAPYDPYKNDLASALQQPSAQHLLGTDQFGRDTLSRLLYGARTALVIGFASVAISAIIGIILGVLAGYFGGVTSLVIMRIIDTLMAFPLVLLALLLAALLGGGLRNLIIALSIATMPPFARIMNGETLRIKENDYITAARANRASSARIIGRHVIPNAFPPIIVQMTLQLGQLILAEASLSFLGIGIEAPGAAWGSMVADGYRFLMDNPVMSFAPGLAIVLVVFAFNMVGDGLIDAVDPRLRGTI